MGASRWNGFYPFLLCFLLPVCASAESPLPSAAVSHPVVAEQALDYRLALDPDALKALAEQALAMDKEKLLALVCTDNGVDMRFSCPTCGAGIEYRFEHPEALTCVKCGALIDEKTLPPTGAIEGKGPLGDAVVLRYSGKGNDRLFVGPLIRSMRHRKLAEAARALGQRYLDTKDERYAVRAIDILEALARAFPHWPVIEVVGFPRPARIFIQPDRPYDHWVHYKWCHTHNYDVPENLTFAYDFVYNSPEWTRRPDARQTVERDLLRAGYQQAWTTHEDMGHAVNNLTGTLLASTILLGRVLGEPDMVHRAVYTLKDMVRVFYHFDGMEYEGALTYHGTVTGRCAMAERMLAGYADPPGYVDSKYRVPIDGLDLKRQIPVYGRAGDVWKIMKLPNGNSVCVHDSAFPTERKSVTPDTEAPDIALNAYGHFALGRGKGLQAIQTHLHFCPFSQQSHYHQDKLQIILFGAGEELLSDIGYVTMHKKNRYFATTSISHNTVTVEYPQAPPRIELAKAEPSVVGTVERPKAAAAANRPVQDARSTLLACVPGVRSGKQVQLVAASVPDAPILGLGRRTRELLTIGLDDARSCVVDVFRIRGGARHNFILRPSCDEDVATEVCSLPLGAERPGTLAGENLKYDEAPGKGIEAIPYSWLVHKLRVAPAGDDWNLTWHGADSDARLRVFMAGMPGAELWIGQSPTMRRANNNDKMADQFQNPHMLLRRADSGAGNTFAAVYEPVPKGAKSLIRDVRFDVAGAKDAGAPVAVRIVTDDGEFLVTATCADAPGAASIAPRYSVVARRAGKETWTWRYGADAAKLPMKKVLRVENGDACNGFVVVGEVAEDRLRPGEWIRVLYGEGQAFGYQVAEVTRQGSETTIAIAGEPGFTWENGLMRLLYYPFYDTPGKCEVEIVSPIFEKR